MLCVFFLFYPFLPVLIRHNRIIKANYINSHGSYLFQEDYLLYKPSRISQTLHFAETGVLHLPMIKMVSISFPCRWYFRPIFSIVLSFTFRLNTDEIWKASSHSSHVGIWLRIIRADSFPFLVIQRLSISRLCRPVFAPTTQTTSVRHGHCFLYRINKEGSSQYQDWYRDMVGTRKSFCTGIRLTIADGLRIKYNS